MAGLRTESPCVISPPMRTEQDQPTAFALNMQAALGAQLIVARSEREPWSLVYDVLFGAIRVGSVSLADPCAVAKLVSAEGEWRLQKRRRLG